MGAWGLVYWPSLLDAPGPHLYIHGSLSTITIFPSSTSFSPNHRQRPLAQRLLAKRIKATYGHGFQQSYPSGYSAVRPLPRPPTIAHINLAQLPSILHPIRLRWSVLPHFLLSPSQVQFVFLSTFSPIQPSSFAPSNLN